MQRLEDWEPRLIALANDWRRKPYVYGSTDCACFAQAAVEAVTGVVLLPAVDRPKGWIAAAKFMIARGWESVDDMATELLGPPADPATSRRGDIVCYEEFGETHLAVRVGSEALTPTANGLAIVQPSRWRRAWKVG